MKRILIATAALLLAGPAFAGDLEPKRGAAATVLPAPKEPIQSTDDHSWNGIWLGAFAGYGISNSELTLEKFHESGTNPVVVTSIGKGEVDGFGGEGFFGQLQAGYDRQLGDRIVAGVFGGVSFSSSESSASLRQGPDVPGNSADTLKVEEGDTYFGGARVGYLLNQHNMVYVAGGYFWNIDTEVSINDESKDFDFEGWFGEVGFESRIAENVYARLSGRYYWGEEEKLAGRSGTEPCWDDIHVDPAKLEIMAGLSFKLNGFKY